MQVIPPEIPEEEAAPAGLGHNRPPPENVSSRGEPGRARESGGDRRERGGLEDARSGYTIYARYARGCWFYPPPDGRDLRKIQALEQTHEELVRMATSSGMRNFPQELWPTDQAINPTEYMRALVNSNRGFSESLDRLYNSRGMDRRQLPGEGMGEGGYVAGHKDQLNHLQGRLPGYDAHHSPRTEALGGNPLVPNWRSTDGTTVLIPKDVHVEVHKGDLPRDKSRASPYDAQEHDLGRLQEHGLSDEAAAAVRKRNEELYNIRKPHRRPRE